MSINEERLMNQTKIALVVEGGAMRGIFATGVLDAFIEADFNPFEWCIGVSAGSTNLAAYLASMHKRNYRVYTEYSIKPEFVSFKNYLKGGHLMDLDWLWRETIRDMRLDLGKIVNGPSRFLVGVTNAMTGQIEYLEPKMDDLETIIKASSALPIMYRHPIMLDQIPYVDGGVAAPIPIQKAIELGAKIIIVLRSQKKIYRMKAKPLGYERLMLRQYPKLIKTIKNRSQIYNDQIDLLREQHKDIQIVEICPPEAFETSRLTRDIQILEKDYQLGVKEGQLLMKRFLEERV